tara:strand:+ start:89555 stop:90223 length:669 start_codon:yes stop_codon:yes gene_type:complete
MTSAMFKSPLLLSTFSLVLAGACSGGSGGGGGGGGLGDAAPRTDSGSFNSPDARDFSDAGGLPDAECAEVADFGNLGPIDGVVFGDGVDYLSIDSTLDATAPVDLFIVELFAGFAPFEKGLTTGTFQITGDQTDYNTCGACIGIFANLPDKQAPEMVYTAQSGTLVITSVEGTFAGSFTPSGGSASFVGFSFDGDVFVREDSCTVSGGGATWNKAIEQQSVN